MSNPFAVAAVTACFQDLLRRVNTENPAENILSETNVTARAPDLARPATSNGRQLNLFLYEAAPNAAWRNMDLPFRGGDGEMANRPVLALNLQYLLTAYGEGDDDLDAHHLLAYAMSLVHDNAVLSREQIRAVVEAHCTAAGLDPTAHAAKADLADQVELVKICPRALTLQEMSELWSAFQTGYRLSVGYEASVVLIERPRQPGRVAPPVRAASIHVVPFRRPTIESVAPQVVTTGATLTIHGRNLRGDVVTVRCGGADATITAIDDRQIEITLPNALPAGVTTLQVVHELALGDPPTPHRGFESNVAAFILAPRITTSSTPADPIDATTGQPLALEFTPSVGPRQRVSILVGDREIALPPRDPQSPPAGTLNFPIPSDFPPGTYLLRLRVDGAESPLEVDTDEASPTFNQYVNPVVTVVTVA
jgi:hypothetical protein